MREETTSEGGGGPAARERVACWFCEHRLAARTVLRDGIIRSRAAAAGGPYRLYVCPACGRENLCEKTPRGRWFSSPNYRFSFLDYLFSHVLDAGEGARTMLAAISWFRENEDRRRYFFERDGDRRYSSGGFLRRIWPMAPPPAPAPAPGPEAGSESETEAPPPPRPRPRRTILRPEEILGVTANATEEEIRGAFRRLAVHYHPDKVHHRGEEMERLAQVKFLRLKEAYESLIAMRRKE